MQTGAGAGSSSVDGRFSGNTNVRRSAVVRREQTNSVLSIHKNGIYCVLMRFGESSAFASLGTDMDARAAWHIVRVWLLFGHKNVISKNK